jgi:hypothetical protein
VLRSWRARAAVTILLVMVAGSVLFVGWLSSDDRLEGPSLQSGSTTTAAHAILCVVVAPTAPGRTPEGCPKSGQSTTTPPRAGDCYADDAITVAPGRTDYTCPHN